MRKTAVLISFGLFTCLLARGQHNMAYRQLDMHEVFYNPAAAGAALLPVTNLSYQKQWLGIPQSPNTLMASGHVRLGSRNFYNPKMMVNTGGLSTGGPVGLGLGMYADQNGPAAARGLNLNYAYHLTLDKAFLGLGIGASVEQQVLSGSSWDPIQAGDPLLGAVKESLFQVNANLGVVYTRETFYGGIAVSHVLPLEDKMDPGKRVAQDFLLHGSYLFPLREAIQWEPALFLRYLDYERFEYDVRIRAYLRQSHWMALTYRSYKALNLSLGFSAGAMYLAYQFEMNLGPLISYSAGTHGIHMGLNLGMRPLD